MRSPRTLHSRGLLLLLALTLGTSLAQAQPGEVTGLRWVADTLTWDPVPGATSYTVHAGETPWMYNHDCRISGITETSVVPPDWPRPTGFTYVLVTAVNSEGEGTLGTDSLGNPTPNLAPCIPDFDLDGIGDPDDNCPMVANADQANSDTDSFGDACDNCPTVDNEDQQNLDFDTLGSACDNCPTFSNEDQQNSDADTHGDACDNCPALDNDDQADDDVDGTGEACDNCPGLANPTQDDPDVDGLGSACDICPDDADPLQEDTDGDGTGEACDNCPGLANPMQEDPDADDVGTACDGCPDDFDPFQEDSDGDGTNEACDNCPGLSNADQADDDVDDAGNDCDNCLGLANPEQLDDDADTLGNACDNCPFASNLDQEDHNDDGIGDPCDPKTYTFEDDLIDGRPADMLSYGGLDETLLVRMVEGELAASYRSDRDGTNDQFTRVRASGHRQDTTVWLDYGPFNGRLSLEMWSDSAFRWESGAGLMLQVDDRNDLYFIERFQNQGVATPVAGPRGPDSRRLRLRLRKGAGTTSRLHVDYFIAGSWSEDEAIFDVVDDSALIGVDTAMADFSQGRRSIKRITVCPEPGPTDLTIGRHHEWSDDWKVFQRDDFDEATIPLQLQVRHAEPAFLQARVVMSDTGTVVPDHDWSDHQLDLSDPAPNGATVSFDLDRVPAGGNYDVEVQLVRSSDMALLGSDMLVELGVGDVFLCTGQSNMSGRGDMADAETPIDEVHVYHADGLWKMGQEPMDDATGEREQVAADNGGGARDAGHSPMLRFGKEVHASTGLPVGIIPSPRGGTAIWDEWQRDVDDPDSHESLYGNAMRRARDQNDPNGFAGVLWFQGESDAADNRTLEQYRDDLERLISQLRSDLSQPDLPFFIAQLATSTAVGNRQFLRIREAQLQVVERDADAYLITAIDALRFDNYHFFADSYKMLGVRFADAVREHLLGEPLDALVHLTSVQVGPGGSSVDFTFDGEVEFVDGGLDPELFRFNDDTGPTATGVTVMGGNTVRVTLSRALTLPATASYGFTQREEDDFLRDLRGTPVPCFDLRPIDP
ncbi:MAG: sialate O-acetylesterase [Acidobacteriota bacterium]